MIPISEAAIRDMNEDDKVPYASEGSFTRWYIDTMQSKWATLEKGGSDD